MSGTYMPYLLEKGPFLEVLEDKLSDPIRRREALRDLRDPTKFVWNLVGLESPTLNVFVPLETTRKEAFRHDWLGIEWDGTAWRKSNSYYWRGWKGDPEAIFRQGLIRAIEVSFGLGDGDPLPTVEALTSKKGSRAAPHPCWPIDFYWICQGPLFQAWVLWRNEPGMNVGHVSVVLSTPAATGHPLVIQITRPAVPPPPKAPLAAGGGYAANPPNTVAGPPPEHGMWVVGHEDHRMIPTPTIAGSSEGNAPVNGQGDATAVLALGAPLRFEASGPVVTVRPSENEGGIFVTRLRY